MLGPSTLIRQSYVKHVDTKIIYSCTFYITTMNKISNMCLTFYHFNVIWCTLRLCLCVC